MFSLLESFLQDQMKWKKEPFKKLKAFLKKEHDESELSKTFDNYQHAINVLKHGLGSSYDRLFERKPELDFSIKSKGKFFFEGDVSEVGVLIDVDDTFIKNCAELIQKVASIITKNSVRHPCNP